jgi:hypothetical protein
MQAFEPDYWIDDIRQLIPAEVAHAAQGVPDEVKA